MSEPLYESRALDIGGYIAELKRAGAAGQCFICDIVRDPESADRPIVFHDDVCVAVFNRYPRLVGYLLVAPVEHRTAVVGDFTEAEYLALQSRVHRIGRALMEAVPTERLYVFSFGSEQGVSHVHWHLAALPPGVSFEEQQFAAVDRAEYLAISYEDRAELAETIRRHIDADR